MHHITQKAIVFLVTPIALTVVAVGLIAIIKDLISSSSEIKISRSAIFSILIFSTLISTAAWSLFLNENPYFVTAAVIIFLISAGVIGILFFGKTVISSSDIIQFTKKTIFKIFWITFICLTAGTWMVQTYVRRSVRSRLPSDVDLGSRFTKGTYSAESLSRYEPYVLTPEEQERIRKKMASDGSPLSASKQSSPEESMTNGLANTLPIQTNAVK